MVNGLDTFSAFFQGFQDAYIIIGGAACDRQFEDKGIEFRSTKDLDIILVAEALTPEFVQKFWDFITEGEYAITQTTEGENRYYRFVKPQAEGYPYMLELFSRRPDVITPKKGVVLTPIPVGEDVSSLSAILLDEEYYQLTISNSKIMDGLHIAGEEALLCLKAKAYLELTERKAKGEKVDSKDIKKHSNDVFKIAVTIAPEPIDLPPGIRADLSQYISQITAEAPEIKDVLKQVNITNTSLEEVLTLIKTKFKL